MSAEQTTELAAKMTAELTAEQIEAQAAELHREETKRKIVNRLKRANGQLTAVIAAVEHDSHCRDVVQQLAAVSKALDRAGFIVISNALQECITDPDNATGPSRDELEKLFLSLA